MKIYHFFHEKISHNIFVDETCEFVSAIYVHPETGDSMVDEAIGRVVERAGGELIELVGSYCFPDNPEDDMESEMFVDEDSIQEWISKAPIKEMLKEAMRVTDTENSAPAEEAEEQNFTESEVVNHIGPLSERMTEQDEGESFESDDNNDSNEKKDKKMSTKKSKKSSASSKKVTVKKSTAAAAPKKTAAKSKAKKPAAKKAPAKKPAAKKTKGSSKKK